MPSFYEPNLKPECKQLTITGSEYNHIVNVFRKRIGDLIKLNSGNGLLAEGKISSISKGSLTVDIETIRYFEMSEPQLAVAFALLRNKNDEFIVEKLTELGIKELFPFISENTVRKPGNNTISRFQDTAIAAIKQCDNPFMPIIHETTDLKKTLNFVREQGFQPIIASELEDEPLLAEIVSVYNKPLCIFIGPEGGFSPIEFRHFKDTNTLTYKLCNRVLRAETAAITSVAQLVEEYLKINPEYQ
ncbi:MAG: 16S rRNA (uracil(1498)-N(3))-methyltransferase [Candidatus Cloacimonetes bacterium]|nr:16S rRNA (uracil(1498)-N(3))-methyltransferase [Candidatus Cloacimonadota bacterium]